MNITLKKLPAAVLLIGGVIIMQIHAIEFWTRYAGEYGVLWSVMLEGAALWLWSQRSLPKNILALIASTLVLCGPLYEVSAPAIQQYQQAITQPDLNAKREQQLITERAQITSNLATYNANSESRVGWAQRIDEANRDLNRVNAALSDLYADQSNVTAMPWQALAAIAMQALALMIFQILIVLCIRSLSELPTKAESSHSKARGSWGQNLLSFITRNTEKQTAKASSLKAAA
ncbi:MAG: hypothetical protein CMI13_04260 [Oleibacter sp.]|nr:hypothetical protein [Thalassolituus sp.]|tara:strand:- start:2823 stop:3518 length:696 start_codon:yes stop_codon:yes gene_type:complete